MTCTIYILTPYLRLDAEYESKLNALKDVLESVQLVVNEVERG